MEADDNDVLVVLCTCPDESVAVAIARKLVGERLAACVNVVPRVVSIYEWEGAVQQDTEVLAIIKTTRRCYPGLEAAIVAQHPYELPEIIAVTIDSGLNRYLEWISGTTR
jgi:periplasmic divalent cation tolerance protein